MTDDDTSPLGGSAPDVAQPSAPVGANTAGARVEQRTYRDADAFKPGVLGLRNEIIAAEQTIQAGQTFIQFPGFAVYRLKTFARIVDGQLAEDTTLVGFTMDDDVNLTFNGQRRAQQSIAVGHSGARYKAVEQGAGDYGVIVFTPAIKDRGWPETADAFAVVAVSETSLQRLRLLLASALDLAGDDKSESLLLAGNLREELVCAIDDACQAGGEEPPRSDTNTFYFEIVEGVDRYCAAHIEQPIYSTDIARHLGVSVRTVSNAVNQYRNTSLHRYVRLKRLSLVRRKLIEEDDSIKSVALAHGFWHLGEFASTYRQHYGENPSDTVARKRDKSG